MHDFANKNLSSNFIITNKKECLIELNSDVHSMNDEND